MMDQKHIDEAEGSFKTLGPNYFVAREVAETFIKDFTAEQFEPLAKEFADTVYSKVLDSFQEYLMSNTEMNIQSEIWRRIDDTVKALLSGEKWAMERFLLGERYDCEKIRATVATYIPAELQDKRLSELQAENERLAKDNKWLRERYS